MSNNRSPWPVVAITALILAAMVVLLWLVPNSPEARSTVILLGAALPPLVASLYIGQQMKGAVDDVHKQVNGRMSELVQKLPDPPTTKDDSHV